MGITVYVGQKIGEDDQEEAGRAIGAGVVLFLILGLVFSIILVVFTKNLANLLHAPAEAFEQTCEYIVVCGFGTIFIVFYNLLGAIFRGIGDSKTPLLTVCIACVINIVGDLLFVAGFGWGSMGAALATVIAQAVSVIISVLVILKKPLPFIIKREYICFDRRIIINELKLGIPIALQEFLVGISFMVIQTVVNSIGVTASAVILQAHDYLQAYAIDTFFTAIMFCYIGYYNGCGNTFFVMIQGIVGAFCVRIPVVLFMSGLANATLFHIGIGTPASTVCQIIMCVTFMVWQKKKNVCR